MRCFLPFLFGLTSCGASPHADSGSAHDGGNTGDASSDVRTQADARLDIVECRTRELPSTVERCRVRGGAPHAAPEVEWEWAGHGADDQVFVIPLVANLTDDNHDGTVDVCDVPDVVLIGFDEYSDTPQGRLYVLDGATGVEHFFLPEPLEATVTPALGDIDGDGLVEIVAVQAGTGLLIAFENDGRVAWTSAYPWSGAAFCSLALADLDGDGTVEVLAGNLVYDSEGNLTQAFPDRACDPAIGGATTAADLDGDGDLEIILGPSAYHHTGERYYGPDLTFAGYPQVADLDGDPQPEIVVTGWSGVFVLDHRGVEVSRSFVGLPSPAAIFDIDGNASAEIAIANQRTLTLFEADWTALWSVGIDDVSAAAVATGFDLSGDGTREVIYADEHQLYFIDANGTELATFPRSSGTGTEYPVVVDVDNDGDAEVLVVSNAGWQGAQTSPALRVFGGGDGAWTSARRIHNQHTYHVTNVLEDGRVPRTESPHWRSLNTFRTQTRIDERGQPCAD